MSNYGLETINMFKFYTAKNSILQADGDSGDSAQRVGTFFSLAAMAKLHDLQINGALSINYEDCVLAHTAQPGAYRRSTDSSHWGYNTNNFSRDQWQAMQLAFAARGDKRRLYDSFKALLGRYLFHQNTHEGTDGNKVKTPDIAHPTHFSVLIRGLGLGKFLFPVLYVLDCSFLFDLLLRKNATDYDNMLAPQLLYANLVSSTLISRLAMRLYVKTDFIACLDAYHSVARNGILPFPALFWYAYQVNKMFPGK